MLSTYFCFNTAVNFLSAIRESFKSNLNFINDKVSNFAKCFFSNISACFKKFKTQEVTLTEKEIKAGESLSAPKKTHYHHLDPTIRDNLDEAVEKLDLIIKKNQHLDPTIRDNLDEAVEKLDLIIKKIHHLDPITENLKAMRKIFEDQKEGTITGREKDYLLDYIRNLKK